MVHESGIVHDKTGGSITDTVRETLNEIANKNAEILAIIGLPNISQHNDEMSSRMIKGTAVIVESDSIIRPELFPQLMFTTCAVYPIKSDSNIEKYGDSFFSKLAAKNLSSLSKAISFNTDHGASLEKIYLENCATRLKGKDREQWTASLGSKGFWTISKHEPAKCDASYYICVYATHDKLSKELHNLIENEEEKEIETRYSIESTKNKEDFKNVSDFIESDVMEHAKALCAVNTNRCANEIAQMFGVEIDNQEYSGGKVDSRTGRSYKIGIPSALTFYGDTYNSKLADENGKSVACTMICNGAATLNSSQGGCVIPEGHMKGIKLYGGDDVATLVQLKNSMASVIPCGTGHTKILNLDEELKPYEKRYICQHLYWIGKEQDKTFEEQTVLPKIVSKKYKDTTILEEFIESKSVKGITLEHVVGFCQ